VLIWSGEDDPEDTIIPRLLASGADLGRCYIVGDVIDGQRRPFDPSVDMPRLQKAAAAIPGGADLMLVDPVVSAVLGDSHKNAEVRRSLQPLVDLASSLGAAVLGITHHTKGTQGRDPVERVTGSIAFGALARIVFAVARMPEDQGGGRVFCRSKSNIGEDSGGFEYDLELVDVAEGISCTAVCWAGPVEGTARDILAKAEAVQDDPDQRSELDEAKEFLLNILADSDLSSKQVRADADGAGHAWRTVERAQKALGIQPYKKGMKEGWFWTLEARRPPKNAEDRHKKAWRSSNNNGGLRACGLDRDEDYDLTEGAV
jgi:putative DNA primase/helicase